MDDRDDELCGLPAVNREWIAGLVDHLSASIDLREAILFGSRARGDHDTWSDYDLCVISPSFAGMAPWDRMALVLRGWKGHRPCEPVCYTPEEFAASDFSLPRSIRAEGIRVA